MQRVQPEIARWFLVVNLRGKCDEHWKKETAHPHTHTPRMNYFGEVRRTLKFEFFLGVTCSLWREAISMQGLQTILSTKGASHTAHANSHRGEAISVQWVQKVLCTKRQLNYSKVSILSSLREAQKSWFLTPVWARQRRYRSGRGVFSWGR